MQKLTSNPRKRSQTDRSGQSQRLGSLSKLDKRQLVLLGFDDGIEDGLGFVVEDLDGIGGGWFGG